MLKQAIFDSQFLLRYQTDKDASAFYTLYQQGQLPLFRYFYILLQNQTLAETLSYRVWTDLANNCDAYTDNIPVEIWLYDLAHQHLLRHLNTLHKGWIPAFAQGSVTTPDSLEATLGKRDLPLLDTNHQEMAAHKNLRHQLPSLPLPALESFVLRHECLLSMNEIGELCNITPQNAQERYTIAHDRLLGSFAEQGIDWQGQVISDKTLGLLYAEVVKRCAYPSATLDQSMQKFLGLAKYHALQQGVNIFKHKSVILLSIGAIALGCALLLTSRNNGQQSINIENQPPITTTTNTDSLAIGTTDESSAVPSPMPSANGTVPQPVGVDAKPAMSNTKASTANSGTNTATANTSTDTITRASTHNDDASKPSPSEFDAAVADKAQEKNTDKDTAPKEKVTHYQEELNLGSDDKKVDDKKADDKKTDDKKADEKRQEEPQPDDKKTDESSVSSQ